MSAEEILAQFGEHFMNNNMFESGLRSVLWAILKCLNGIGNSCVNLLDKAYSILTFNIGNSEELKSILDPFSSGEFIVALMVLVLVLIGLFMILGNRNLGGTKIVQNILLGVLMFTIMPLIINTFNNVFTETDMSMDVSLASSFDANTYDIQYMFTANGDEPAEDINDFSSAEGAWIDTINICEVIRGSKVTNDIDDVFSKVYKDGAVTTGGNGEILGIYLEPFANDYYYRYHVDMLPIFITCIATILVMIFTFFKVARLTYEMLWNQLFVKILSVTDVVSGTKIKESVKAIGGTYVVLLYIPLSIKVFCAFQNWLFSNTKGENALYSTFEAALLLIAVAMAVIDGPNLIEKIFGVDAGIKSGFHTAMGIAAAGRTAMGIMGRGVNGVKGAYNLGKDISGKSGPLEKRRALKNTKLSNWAWNKAGEDTGTGEKKDTSSTGAVTRSAAAPYSERGRQTAKNSAATGAVGRQTGNTKKETAAQAKTVGTTETAKKSEVNVPPNTPENGSAVEDKKRNIGAKPTTVQGNGGKEKKPTTEKANGAVNRAESATTEKTSAEGKNTAKDTAKENALENTGMSSPTIQAGEQVSDGAASRPAGNTNTVEKKESNGSPKKQAFEKSDALNRPVSSQKNSSVASSKVATTPATPIRERKDAMSAHSSTQRMTEEAPISHNTSVAQAVSSSPSASVQREASSAPVRSAGDSVNTSTHSAVTVSNRPSAVASHKSTTNTLSTPNTQTIKETSSSEKKAKRKADLK